MDGRGTWCGTYRDSVELFWRNNQFKRVIPLNPSSNIALVRTAPKPGKFALYCSKIATMTGEQAIYEGELLAMPAAAVISDDEGVKYMVR